MYNGNYGKVASTTSVRNGGQMFRESIRSTCGVIGAQCKVTLGSERAEITWNLCCWPLPRPPAVEAFFHWSDQGISPRKTRWSCGQVHAHSALQINSRRISENVSRVESPTRHIQGGAKKRGHDLFANILKFHDRIAWKLVNFCNIICWTQSLTFCLKISSRCVMLKSICTMQINDSAVFSLGGATARWHF